MEDFARHELQRSLNHDFRNILLLHEALTISYDNPTAFFKTTGITYKKRTFYRLKTLGTAVLKMVSSEYSVRACNSALVSSEIHEGSATRIAQRLITKQMLKNVGQKFKLKSFVEVDSERKKQSNFKIENLYGDLIRAIFGAVFVDHGGAHNQGLEAAFKLFTHLWEDILTKLSEASEFLDTFFCLNLHRLEIAFPVPPKVDLLTILGLECDVKKLKRFQRYFGYTFRSKHLLIQALTHDSVNQYSTLKNVPHYQVMEFLGDAVFELAIREYLFWHCLGDENGEYFNHTLITKFTNAQFQNLIADELEIEKYIRKPQYVVVNNRHDFIESVLGAVYIDSQGGNHSFGMAYRMVTDACITVNTPELHQQIPFFQRTYYCSDLRDDKNFEHDDTPEKQPPVAQNAINVPNVGIFLKNWKTFSFSKDSHNKKLTGALDSESIERQHKPMTSSHSFCNSLEFNRQQNVFRIVARMGLKSSLWKTVYPEPEYIKSRPVSFGNTQCGHVFNQMCPKVCPATFWRKWKWQIENLVIVPIMAGIIFKVIKIFL